MTIFWGSLVNLGSKIASSVKKIRGFVDSELVKICHEKIIKGGWTNDDILGISRESWS